jgi:ABC-2 type transport system permease protein
MSTDLKKAIPLLIRPTYQTFLTRWSSKEKSTFDRGRDLLLLSFSLIIGVTIFFATTSSLTTIKSLPALASLPPLYPISIAMMLLLFMLLTSNVVSSLIFLYLSKDLERIVSSPVTLFKLFFDKAIHICIISSWMPFIFLLPFLMAFGWHFEAGLLFYAVIPLVLIPYFIIPTALGIIIATLVSLVLPARRSTVARCLFACVLIFVGFAVLSLIYTSFVSLKSSIEITRLIKFFTLPATYWLPSRWVAYIFDTILLKKESSALPEWVLLYATTLWTCCFSYIFIEILFPLAYSNTQVEPVGKSAPSPSKDTIIKYILSGFSLEKKAMILKEIRSLTRDPSHVFEVFMLACLSSMYLANLKSFAVIDTVPLAERAEWMNQIFILNVAMNSFIITSLCVRFVFPSVSREGESYWILASSPLSKTDILESKRSCWLYPILLLGESFLLLSALLLKVPLVLIVIHSILCMAICYVVVSAAVGLGTVFALKDSEHPSQVSGGLGSLLYMLFATVVILTNLLSIKLILFSFSGSEVVPSDPIFLVRTFVIICVILFLDFKAAKWAMKQGEKTLLLQMN